MVEVRTDAPVNLQQLAAEVAAAHGWSDAPLSYRAPGQVDEDGQELPGVVIVDHDEADEDVVADVVAAHTPETSAVDDAIARLADLHAKGWANLTASERAEVVQHTLTILGS